MSPRWSHTFRLQQFQGLAVDEIGGFRHPYYGNGWELEFIGNFDMNEIDTNGLSKQEKMMRENTTKWIRVAP